MASLADVNQTLMDQNESLADIARGTLDTQQLIQKQISADTGFKAIETSREKGGGVGGAVSGTLKGIQDTGKKLGSFFSGKGLAGIGAALIGGLVTRGIPALVATSLSDNIAEYLTGEEGNQEVKETIERSIIGGSLGFLLGWRGALIGSLLGALLNEENKAKLTELKDKFGTLAEEFNLELPTFEKTLKFFTDSFGNLISFFGGIVGTITGITRAFKAFTDDDETTSGFEELGTTASDTLENFKENALGAVAAVGGIFALLRPGKAIGLALAGIKGIGNKAGSLLSKLGGAGAAGAATKTATTAVAATAGSVVKSASGKLMIAGADGKATTVKAPPGSKVGDVPGAESLKKFPRLGKALKLLRGIPLIGGIAALTELAMLDPKTVDGIAGILGGLGGSAVGAAIGTMINPGVGSFLGGIGGYFLGDALFKGLAQYLLGKQVDAFPDFINDMINGKSDSAPSDSGGGNLDPIANAQPLSDLERINRRTTQKNIKMLESGATLKVGTGRNQRDATPEERQARIDKEYDKLAALDEKDFRYKQRMEQSLYRPGTVSESISTEALQENADAKNQPAVVMQDTSTKQVNNVSNSTQPVVAPMVNNLDVNDALMPYAQGI